MRLYLLIGLGGALGSIARHWLASLITLQSRSSFPWGTFCVNVTGCLAIGFFSGLSGPGSRYLASNESRLFFITGICGGYTTFSAFSLQTLELLRAGTWGEAGAYVMGSICVCLLSVWLGQLAAGPFTRAS
jgi:CrcB protein